MNDIETIVKVIIDHSLACLALLLLAPLLIIVGVLIKLDSPGPIFRRHHVIGMKGHQFDAFKFRTMHVIDDEILLRHRELRVELQANQEVKHVPRVTRVGRFLRRDGLDELPLLFNIVLGQMSLVGPRMISPEEAEKYGKWKMDLLTVKPGITGLWQISGRSDVSYAERVRLDLYYIHNYSLWLDIQILWRTVPVVLGRRGAG